VTMNEQHKNFICEIRKCGLLHETDPSLPCKEGKKKKEVKPPCV